MKTGLLQLWPAQANRPALAYLQLGGSFHAIRQRSYDELHIMSRNGRDGPFTAQVIMKLRLGKQVNQNDLNGCAPH